MICPIAETNTASFEYLLIRDASQHLLFFYFCRLKPEGNHLEFLYRPDINKAKYTT